MRGRSVEFALAALPIVRSRIDQLRTLDVQTAAALPEVESLALDIAGHKSSITVFRYNDAHQLEGKVLVVVLAARPTMFGLAQQHVELGLVFSTSEAVRDATITELQNSGG